MITNRWKILLCCGTLLALASAVFYQNREVAGLREEARKLALLSGEPRFFGAAKARTERPAITNDEAYANEDNDLVAGMNAFTRTGDLSEVAIKRLGLTPEEVRIANDAMYQFRAEAERDLAQRLKPTMKHSEGGSLRQLYYARARRDRGQAAIDRLTLALESAIGQDRSRRLMKAFTHDDRSARLCKLDLELEVVSPAENGEYVRVNYQLRSPRDGSVTTFGGSTLEEFENEYGRLFETAEATGK